MRPDPTTNNQFKLCAHELRSEPFEREEAF